MNDFLKDKVAPVVSEGDGPGLGIAMARGTANRIAFQLVMVGEALEEIGDSRLEPTGVDSTGYCILATLSVDTPPSQHELARLMNKAPGVIVAEIDRLEEGGFVQRNRDAADRRRSRVTLTPAGAAALAHADEIADTIIAQLFGGLETDELTQLKRLMNKGLKVEPAA